MYSIGKNIGILNRQFNDKLKKMVYNDLRKKKVESLRRKTKCRK